MVNNNLKGVICGYIAFGSLFLAFILFCAPSSAQQKGSGVYAVDTFKRGDQLIAKKKFRKAAKLYKAYHRNHPKDVNALWKLGQVNLWMNNTQQSDETYREALKLDPKNDNLNLNYIHSLLDMGKLGEAGARLTDMEMAGKDYPNMALLRAKLSYYNGDFKQAAAYMRKDLKLEKNNAESLELNDQIEMARSPLVSLNEAYLTDNQPLTAVISTLKAEKYFNKYATLYLAYDQFHFTDSSGLNAHWVRVGDKLYFPKAGLRMNLGGGIVKFPLKNDIGWSGNLALNLRISSQFDADASVDHVPYLDTRSSVDTNISATRFAAMLNWHKNSWSAQTAFLNSSYEGNSVYGAYAWVLAPLVKFPKGGLLQGGISMSYSNSGESSYKPVLSMSGIVANSATTSVVAGIYNPYFTPNNLLVNSALVSLSLNPSKVVSINLSGDIGYGTINNPYLYLDKDNTGNNVVRRGFSMEYFVPANAIAAINFHLDKTWLLSAKYTYHNSYFFTSHYVSLGIQKSFQHHRRKQGGEGTPSTFSRLIKELEDEIQGLYSCKTPAELKSSVAKVRKHLVTLRDTEKNKRNTETSGTGDEAANAQDHYEALNDMINDLDNVNLDDYETSGSSKKKWLVDKQFELTSIQYEGSLGD